MAIAIFYREELKEYDFGEGHPFRSKRFKNFIEEIKKKLPPENFKFIKPEPATDKDLKLVHSQKYIDFIEKFYSAASAGKILPSSQEIYQFLSLDNLPGANPGKLHFGARLIAGAAKEAGELVWQGPEGIPSGSYGVNKFEKAITFGGLHHAKKNYGEGFCIYNDVAICAENLKRNFGAERILILDTDAHAGNGTAEIFYQDPKVLFIDLHQDPRTLYPGKGFVEEIGEGKGKGFTINCPLLPGTGWDSYQYIFGEIIFPLAEEFQPQLIIRNGGTDPYWNDALTQLGLTIADFRKIGENIREMAKICAEKEIDMIGSGYKKAAIGPGWLSLICGLADIKIPIDEPELVPQKFKKDSRYEDTKNMVRELKRNLKNYWKCFKI